MKWHLDEDHIGRNCSRTKSSGCGGSFVGVQVTTMKYIKFNVNSN